MDFESTTFSFVIYDSKKEKVPYVKPYKFTNGPHKGKTVKDLVKRGIPGLISLVTTLVAYHTDEYVLANSICYELMLEADKIFENCKDDGELVEQYFCALYELFNAMPVRDHHCQFYIHCDEDTEISFHDIIWSGDYDFILEMLELIVKDTVEHPMFVFPIKYQYFNSDKEGTSCVFPGMRVGILQKQDQKTGKLTEGIVQNVLTTSPGHPRGIKVRLENGKIGRVQKIYY